MHLPFIDRKNQKKKENTMKEKRGIGKVEFGEQYEWQEEVEEEEKDEEKDDNEDEQ